MICNSTPGVGEPLQAYLDEVGYRLVSGYDIADKYALEMPEMLVGTIFGAADRADRRGDFAQRRDALRAKVPRGPPPPSSTTGSRKRASSSVCATSAACTTTAWGTGLARRAVLEAGRRLQDSGVLPDAALAINASHEEIVGLLKGGKQPTVEELRRRQTWRETKTVADAPPFLGPEPKGTAAASNGCRRRRSPTRGRWTR